MALLGMGANVQCNGYVPGYHSTRDRIFGTEGSTWTSSNGNIELQNNCYDKSSLPVSSPVHLLDYNKELLKQTILKHEAIFRDQIHELHRLYCRQRELMDEIKRNELDKPNLRLETSWSSSFLSHVSSKNVERIYCSPNLPWSTAQSSAIVAEGIQLPLGSAQANSRQIYSAPAPAPASIPTEGYSKDSEPSATKYRKVGNKLLDLHLPADEYIDSEEGGYLEDERVSKLPRVSGYTIKGVSQAVYDSDKKPYGANSNDLTDLNEPFKLQEEAAAKSDDLMGHTSHRKNPFHDLSMRTELSCHNLPNDVFWNAYKRQDYVVCSDNLSSEQEKKQEQLSFMISADQINQGPWCGRKFSGGENSVGTQGPMCAGLLGPSSDPYQLVTDMRSSGISPLVSLKTPVSDIGESQTAVQALPCFSTFAPFDQSSKPLMGMPGLTGDEFYRRRNITSGPSLDCQNFLLSSFYSGSKTSDPPSIITNNLNRFANQSSSTGHELRKYVVDSEDVEIANNINLNVMPANFSDIMAFQSIKEDLLPKGKPSEENEISTKMESFILKPCDSGVTQGFELKTIEASDLSRKKIHAFNINGEPDISAELHSSHDTPSTVCQNQTKEQKIEEIEKGCVSDINLPSNHVPGSGDLVTARENLTKNEQERGHKSVADIIDLNVCMNEDENMPIDIDLQAPVSPENKESSPPRGESDENQLEMPYQLAGQEYSELQVEEVRIAAEALVSISTSVGHSGLQMTTCPPSESFVSSPLHWFAGIASSVIDHPESDIKADFTGNTNDHEELLPAGIDYFEAMTLKLTEMKVLDCGKSSGQKEEEGGSTSPTQQRKGWTNRGKRRKDFQSEILPSLTSLSRYEVTEDLQTIGGLMEAAGSHPERGSLRGAGRNTLARGRRKSCASASNYADLLLKQQLTSDTKLGIEKRSLISWGNKNRKPRGKRYPARNPQVFLSQVYN